jgi:hypothetical protein
MNTVNEIMINVCSEDNKIMSTYKGRTILILIKDLNTDKIWVKMVKLSR